MVHNREKLGGFIDEHFETFLRWGKERLDLNPLVSLYDPWQAAVLYESDGELRGHDVHGKSRLYARDKETIEKAGFDPQECGDGLWVLRSLTDRLHGRGTAGFKPELGESLTLARFSGSTWRVTKRSEQHGTWRQAELEPKEHASIRTLIEHNNVVTEGAKYFDNMGTYDALCTFLKERGQLASGARQIAALIPTQGQSWDITNYYPSTVTKLPDLIKVLSNNPNRRLPAFGTRGIPFNNIRTI